MSAIKAGDLVMVVRPSLCCGSSKCLGSVFRVVEVVHLERVRCLQCNQFHADRFAVKIGRFAQDGGCCEISRLIKLPGESETVDRKEEAHA